MHFTATLYVVIALPSNFKCVVYAGFWGVEIRDGVQEFGGGGGGGVVRRTAGVVQLIIALICVLDTSLRIFLFNIMPVDIFRILQSDELTSFEIFDLYR